MSVEGHTHDDRYFTESEMNTKLNTKISTPIMIDPNTDLNTITECGFYYCDGANSPNRPIAEAAFSLLVENTGAWGGRTRKQTFTPYNHNNTYTRIMVFNADGITINWYPWVETSIVGHTHDDRYYTESEVNSKIQGVENMIQITMGGVKLVGSGSINKLIMVQGSASPYTNPWQVGVTGLPNGDFIRIVTFPFGIAGNNISGGFNEYMVLKSSSDTYATLVITDNNFISSVGSGYVWYKNDNSIMLKLNVSHTDTGYTWNVQFSYEIYKYQS